jgi:hypothetical protein
MICIKCNLEKLNDQFCKKRSAKSGFSSICKLCQSIYHKKRYKDNEQKQIRKEYAKSYYKENKELILQKVKQYRDQPEIKVRRSKKIKQDKLQNLTKYLWKHAKRRAKEKQLPFTITTEDIKVTEYCPVLGLKLIPGEGKVHDASPTLDKIIPSLGYIPGNIIVMSKKANTLKSNGTLEEHKKLVKWMEEQKL